MPQPAVNFVNGRRRRLRLQGSADSDEDESGGEGGKGHDFIEIEPTEFWDYVQAKLTRILSQLDAVQMGQRADQSNLMARFNKLEQQLKAAVREIRSQERVLVKGTQTWIAELFKRMGEVAQKSNTAVSNQGVIYELLKFLRGEILAAPPQYFVGTYRAPTTDDETDSSAESDSDSETEIEDSGSEWSEWEDFPTPSSPRSPPSSPQTQAV